MIIGDYLLLDANGLYGAFYNENNVSSSFPVVEMLNGRKVKYANIVHKIAPDWFPGPLTSDESIKRLIPSQILNYRTGEILARPLLKKKYKSLNEDDLYNLIVDRYDVSLYNLKKTIKGKIKLAITAGNDSRLSAAMIKRNNINVSAFTLEHGNISDDDALIPQKITDILGFEYTYVKRNKEDYSKARLKEFDEFTGRYSQDEDKLFYAYDQYEKIIDKNELTIILRSVIELKNFNLKDISRDTFYKKYPAYRYDELFSKSMDAYIDWVKKDDQNKELSVNDRFYMDQRTGCWLSSVEQGLDILDNTVSFQLLNSRELMDLIWSFPKELRDNKKCIKELVKRICPELADIPYDRNVHIIHKSSNRIFNRFFMLARRYNIPIAFYETAKAVKKKIKAKVKKL